MRHHIIHRIKVLTAIILLQTTVLALGCRAQLPSVTLRTMDGEVVTTDTLSNGGRPFIIDFFATWCKPCNRCLDAIADVYDEWVRETGVRLIAVSIDQAQNINKVRPLVDSHDWPYDVLLDPNGDLKRALGVQMIPFSLIIDGDGKIVYKHNGYTDGDENEILPLLKSLVNESPSTSAEEKE